MVHRLQYITHTVPGYSPADQVKDVCRAGVRWIQLRMKNASDYEIIAIGREVHHICASFGALFILNDKVHLVHEIGADGVHLGKEDMSAAEARKFLGYNKIIGCTANTFGDIEELTKNKIDYLGVGPFKHTNTKEKLSPLLGVKGYSAIHDLMRLNNIQIPVIAIGGITRNDIDDLMKTGIYGIAVSGAIHKSEDPYEEAKKMYDQINNFENYGTTYHSR